MTCTHVLGLIDAGPFAGYPRAHLDAARDHASRCATCGPALTAATALTADLGALAKPLPPVDLTAVVLARIARVEEQQQMAVTAGPPESRGVLTSFDLSAWLTALGGLAAGLVILSGSPGGLTPIDLASPRVGGMMTGAAAVPSTALATVALAASLGLYVAGLFAPLRSRSSG